MEREYVKGLALAWAANLLWGIYPVLFRQVDGIDPGAFVGYRMAWSTPFLLLVLVALREHHAFLQLWRDAATVRWLILSTALTGLGWGLYVWCVQNGRIVESSLGYLLTPMFNVLLGVWLFGERLDRRRWWCVGLAATGVVYMAAASGVVPVYGIILGAAFAAYAAVRRIAQVEALAGVAAENLVLLPVGVVLILTATSPAPVGADATWMAVAGLATALPLVWYVAAARRIAMATLGNLFYLCPALSFLIGVFVYDEPFTRHHLVMFSMIGIALLGFSLPAGVFVRPRLSA